MKTVFQDDDFQDALVCLVVKDRVTLGKCGDLLVAEDFKPLKGARDGFARWVVAERALDYWANYQQPIRKMLRPEIKRHITSSGVGEDRSKELLDYVGRLMRRKATASEWVIDRVLQFKRERQRAAAIEELIDLQASGKMDQEEWQRITESVNTVGSSTPASEPYFEGLQERIDRRSRSRREDRYPLLFIDPLDDMVRAIAPGHLGMLLAPYKRGKTAGLIWIALAYTLQRLNVLYFPLEDLKEDIEDRFDAAVTSLPVKRLSHLPKTVRGRFERFRRLIKSRLSICVPPSQASQGLSVADIEKVVRQERERGFLVDAVIIDYDDEIVPPRKLNERRHEFAEIYRALGRLATKYDVITWTAAQTKRGTEHLKILSGDRVAEDISKMRKVTFALSIGKGDWGEDSNYLWVAAHRADRQHVGCNIMSDKGRMLFYDREATMTKKRQEAEK